MGENLSHSTLTSNSDLIDYTDSANSGCKRKRDWMMNSTNKTNKLDPPTEHTSLFSTLELVRLCIFPFDVFNGWSDENLWYFIADETGYSMPEIIQIISHYQDLYTKDHKLKMLNDSLLKKTVLNVFRPYLDKLTLDQIPLNILSKSPIGPIELPRRYEESVDLVADSCEMVGDASVTEEDIGSGLRRERQKNEYAKRYGWKGELTGQYVDDLDALPINAAEKCRLILECGPESIPYLCIAYNEPNVRQELLLKFLQSSSSSSSIPSGSSSKRVRSKER